MTEVETKAWFENRSPEKIYESLAYDLIGVFAKIFGISRKSDWPVSARHNKACEELGELGTCVLVEQGFIKHKTLKESSIAESADTIICVLDVLFASHPEMSKDDLIRSLANEMWLKSKKWNVIVDDLNKGKN